jgi:molybdopterin-dependent oxidoreductase alpha subunit
MNPTEREIALGPIFKEHKPSINPRKNSVAGLTAVKKGVQNLFKYVSANQAIKAALQMNQKGGFDCPGCAWPDPDDERSTLGEYCENGMKALAEEAQKKTIGRDFFQQNSVEVLGRLTDFELGKQGRISEPLWLKPGDRHYQPIAWGDAFQKIAQALNQLEDPNQAVFYTSGRTSNEAAFLYQLFVRAYGTNNLPDCSNMCHESSGVALSETLGLGKGSVTLSDFYLSELVIVMGQNPGTNHPRMLSALEKCKQNGGKIVSINPIPEAGLEKFIDPQNPFKIITGGTQLSDLYVPVTLNGDMALLKAIMKKLLLLEEQQPGTIIDGEFIAKNTLHFDQLVEDLKAYSYAELVQLSGSDEKKVDQLVALIAGHKKIIICWAMGITQHKNGVETIREIVNLLLLKGSIGKSGAGTCPVRGHSNVQGDRTMGIWEAPKKEFLEKLSQVYNFSPPEQHGYAVLDAIHALYKGEAKFFMALGGNFLSASPDTLYTAQALKNCALTVHVSTKLNRSHLVHGKESIILPVITRSEIDVIQDKRQFVTVENSMGVVHSSQGVLTPVSKNLMSEPGLLCALAQYTLPKKGDIPWEKYALDYDFIREDIAKVIPGFEDFNNRVKEPGGFYLPNGPREGVFTNTQKKALFTLNQLYQPDLNEKELKMMTIRSHDQYNTTIYGLDDRYRGIAKGRRVILMNSKDILSRGLKAGDYVDLYSRYQCNIRKAENFMVVPYEIVQGCCATYFPEANVLVPIDSFADRSFTPTSKLIVVSLQKSEAH